MTAPNGGLLNRLPLGLVMLAPVLVVTTLVAFLPPDGNERAEWLQFIGRFHPLLVHFPIALFLLVPSWKLSAAAPVSVIYVFQSVSSCRWQRSGHRQLQFSDGAWDAVEAIPAA